MADTSSSTPSSSKTLSANDLSSLHSIPGNSKCADCSSSHPQWASISHGITLCLECSGAHRGLGVHISFVRSLTLDDWTEEQIHTMMCGGNDKFNDNLKDKGVEKIMADASGDRSVIRNKYCGDEAASYRELLAAQAKDDSGKMNVQRMKDDSAIDVPAAAPDTTTTPAVVSLGEDIVPPSPSDYYPIVYDLLLAQKYNLSPTKLASILLGTIAFAITILPKLIPKENSNAIQLLSTTFLTVLPLSILTAIINKQGHAYSQHFQKAYKSANNKLIQEINNNRAYRKQNYDVYLPKNMSKLINNKEINVGLILIPEALVDCKAYSILASKLSDEGILVVVLNLDPYRIPISDKCNANKMEILKIMYQVLAGSTADGTDVGVVNGVKEWVVGGHGMGAIQAFRLCTEMKPGISKLVMWGGMGGLYDLSTHSSLKNDAAVEALVMVGSEDVSYKHMSLFNRNKFRHKLPQSPKTKFVEIKGGNHSAFAHYGPQTYPFVDGVRTITLDEQQDVIVKEMTDFCLGEEVVKD